VLGADGDLEPAGPQGLDLQVGSVLQLLSAIEHLFGGHVGGDGEARQRAQRLAHPVEGRQRVGVRLAGGLAALLGVGRRAEPDRQRQRDGAGQDPSKHAHGLASGRVREEPAGWALGTRGGYRGISPAGVAQNPDFEGRS
jgi:hypothetical protein